ncbi:MAG: hypothetical protein LKJ80_03255 [Oscillibacter sp.]|jgi:hypothetical protein|nr:hypothetical protein [Oscillibacter sp.]
MDKRKLSGSTIGFAVVILLVLALLMANSLHRSSHIVLPDVAAGSAAAGSEPQTQPDAAVKIEITPQTVQTAVATLERPEKYLRTLSVQTIWSGGNSSVQVRTAVSGSLTRTDLHQTNGHIRHVLTDGTATYIWYDSSAAVYSGKAGDISADQEQHIPTYEDVLGLDSKEITQADYRAFSEENCIYVETAPDAGGYAMRYWISVASGLLIGAEKLENGTAVYRMAAQPVSETLPDAADFTLPDGTVLQSSK